MTEQTDLREQVNDLRKLVDQHRARDHQLAFDLDELAKTQSSPSSAIGTEDLADRLRDFARHIRQPPEIYPVAGDDGG